MSSLYPHDITDKDSFIRFVEALIEDRVQADELEAGEPARWRWGGANGWQNSSIASFLECALAGTTAKKSWGSETGPTWAELADFLWLGKIYE